MPTPHAQPQALDDAVVQGLYEAAAGTADWKTALTALDGAVRASAGSQLVVVDKVTGQIVLSEQPDHTSPDGVLDYLREYHRIDPHVPYIAGRPIGEVTHTSDVFPSAQYEQHPFYREFWRPYNVRSFIGTKLGEDEHRVAVLALMQSLDHPAYTPSEIALAGRYLRHCVAAIRIAKYLRNLKTSAAVGHGLMEGSERPMILMDHRHRVLSANSAARQLLDAASIFFVRDGVLHCCNEEGESKLARAFPTPEAQSSRTQGNRLALQFSDGSGAKVFCSVWTLDPETTMSAFGAQPTALLTIASPTSRRTADHVILASMFDFTPAEVRIAAAMLTGETLQEIASSRSLSVETVRSHLRAIFAKTQTHRQAELVQCLERVLRI